MTRWVSKIDILPRWIIILIDIGLLLFSVALGYLLRFNFNLSEIEAFGYVGGISLFIGSGLLATLITRSYKGIIRYTGFQDALRLFVTLLVAVGLVTVANYFHRATNGQNIIPVSVAIISFMAAFILLINYRVLVKILFSYYKNTGQRFADIVIYGSGQTGQLVRQALESDLENRQKIIAFVDRNPNKVGKSLNGIPIIKLEDLVVVKSNVKELVISVQNISTAEINRIVDFCYSRNIKVRHVPPIEKWMNGNLNPRQIKEVKIEDLLGRDSIKLDNYYVKQELHNKTIVVSGAAGSIGGELVRQIILYQPRMIILIDQWESGLFEIENELRRQNLQLTLMSFVVDVNNRNRIKRIFEDFRPDIVYHAAAYKHVPLMENNPSEAIQCNVGGTKNLADISIETGVDRFVMISTDKAVNPTSVMGASKRIAEMYVQSLNNLKIEGRGIKTRFITTRFGNVLGSNGSVIPVFEEQISKGGPITVTHPEITRFFMTIPEACQLVLEASAMGQGGEIFIFDMGRSVKILDLARKMIKLSGLEEGKDVEIIFTGLREGEKLHEELLSDREDNTPTYHQKILIAKVREVAYFKVVREVEKLLLLSAGESEKELVQEMKELVPEYVSNSSRYEALDKSKVIGIQPN